MTTMPNNATFEVAHQFLVNAVRENLDDFRRSWFDSSKDFEGRRNVRLLTASADELIAWHDDHYVWDQKIQTWVFNAYWTERFKEEEKMWAEIERRAQEEW